MRLSQLATTIGAELVGDGNLEATSCATLDDATPGQVSFLSNPRYGEKVMTTRASAVVVSAAYKTARADLALLRAKDPYFAFREAVVALHGFRRHPHTGIAPGVTIDPTASVGEGTVIYPGCYIGPRAKIGRDCILYPNVVVYDDCVIGDRVTLHANTVIGQDGFGYATHAGAHHKIPQVGNVIVEDDVEMGAGCAIERATMGSTVIGKGTKFCDLIAIGHGTKVGRHCLLVAQVGIAGSTTVGDYVVMGGQAGVAGHLKIGNQSQLSAQAGVMEDVEDKTIMIGSPAMPAGVARRVYNHFMNLDALVGRLKELEKKVATIEGARQE